MTNKQTIAKEAAKLIRKGWTKGTMARTKDGRRIPYTENEAVSFCARGALARACVNLNQYECFMTVENEFEVRIDNYSMAEYNDSLAKSAEDVAKVFDEIANDK